MGQNGVCDQLLGCFTSFLLQCIYISKERHLYNNDPDWCSRWWYLADWQWKVGFTPRANKQFCQCRQHSSSGAITGATSGYWAWLLPVRATILKSHFKSTPIGGLRWAPLHKTVHKNSAQKPCTKMLHKTVPRTVSVQALCIQHSGWAPAQSLMCKCLWWASFTIHTLARQNRYWRTPVDVLTERRHHCQTKRAVLCFAACHMLFVSKCVCVCFVCVFCVCLHCVQCLPVWCTDWARAPSSVCWYLLAPHLVHTCCTWWILPLRGWGLYGTGPAFIW